MRLSRDHSAMTLIELLLIIAIIGVLFALLLPAVQRVRDSVARTRCSNQMRQIGLALYQYHDVHLRFPPGVSYNNGNDVFPFMSWNTRLLPFLEQGALWNQSVEAYLLVKYFLDNPPHVALSVVMPLFSCPSDSRTISIAHLSDGKEVAFTDYLGVEGTDQSRQNGVLYLDSRINLSGITDGASNTLLVGERPPSADGILGWWYAGEGQFQDGSCDMVLGVQEINVGRYGENCPIGPYSFSSGRPMNQCDAFHFWSLHTAGAHFLFADGSVHFLSYSVASLLPALATRSGGEPASLSD